jgi:ribonuclease P protein component
MVVKVTRDNFDTVLKKGKNIHSPLLSFKYVSLDETDPKPSKFSFVISGKVAKLAVERNLFKRRGRHIIRKEKSNLRNGYMGAFFAKAGITKIMFAELEKEVVSLLKKSDILK